MLVDSRLFVGWHGSSKRRISPFVVLLCGSRMLTACSAALCCVVLCCAHMTDLCSDDPLVGCLCAVGLRRAQQQAGWRHSLRYAVVCR